MDIGDRVIFGGKRFYVRGFDPVGVDPRFVYLEEAMTGAEISVAWNELSRANPGGAFLRLVDDDARSSAE